MDFKTTKEFLKVLLENTQVLSEPLTDLLENLPALTEEDVDMYETYFVTNGMAIGFDSKGKVTFVTEDGQLAELMNNIERIGV